jgi:hypothetical protein
MPPLEKPKLHPPERPERWPLAVRVGAAVWPEMISTGLGSLGLSANVGVRYRWFSADAELHGDPSLGSVTTNYVGEVSVARLSGALLLCAHIGWFAACGIGDVGRFFFPKHPQALPASAFYGAAGVEAVLEAPVAPPRLFVSTALDLRAPIHPTNFTRHGVPVFEAAGLSGGLRLGVLFELAP